MRNYKWSCSNLISSGEDGQCDDDDDDDISWGTKSVDWSLRQTHVCPDQDAFKTILQLISRRLEKLEQSRAMTRCLDDTLTHLNHM